MGRGAFFDKFQSDFYVQVVVGLLGAAAAALGFLLLKKFPSLGVYTPLIGALLVLLIVWMLSLFYVRRVRRLRSLEAGVASGKRPAVLLARLAGDGDDTRQLEIDRFIRRTFKDRVEVLLWDEQVEPGLGSRDKRESFIRGNAEKWLSQTNCHVLVFGSTGASGATHLSFFSKSKGVDEVRGLSGELLDLDEEISDQLAQHVAAQLVKVAIDESGGQSDPADLDALVAIVDQLLPSVKDRLARFELLGTKAVLSFQKTFAANHGEGMHEALALFEQARDCLDPSEHEHQRNQADLNAAICDLNIGMRNGDRARIEKGLERLDEYDGQCNGAPCETCRELALFKRQAARIKLIQNRWDYADWKVGFDDAKLNLEKINDKSKEKYWNASLLVLQYIYAGMTHLEDIDDFYDLSHDLCHECLAIHNGISRRVKVELIFTAASVQFALYRRLGNARLGEKAIELLDDCLGYVSKDSDTRVWAEIMVNKCATMAQLGKFQPGTLTLQRAINCGCSALELLDPSDSPMEWARASNVLGTAYDNLAQRDMDPRLFECALEFFAGAAVVFGKLRSHENWAMCRLNLAVVQCFLADMAYRRAGNEAERTRAKSCFAAAERAANRVSAFYDASGNKPGFLMSLACQAFIYNKRGSATGDDVHLESAISSCRLGLELADPLKDGVNWSVLTFNLGNGLFQLGHARRNEQMLAEARAVLENYIEAFSSDADSQQTLEARNLLAALKSRGE